MPYGNRYDARNRAAAGLLTDLTSAGRGRARGSAGRGTGSWAPAHHHAWRKAGIVQYMTYVAGSLSHG
ncbi:hypothetical protein GCM10010259_43980 [Streptomyces daghestanicus]|uniref:Transposase n=1 Tax=Streptomyces daghestanicus TaxID=66885 RepID=A0ABQ3PZB1_9ACTN|nr:hypothetical protein GCM10010259_43980 [Streptomyces daghestanicus]GHI30349.1 hypothetical protein Sdagh_20790 [Streptomyces daghestanicus]